MGPSEVFPVGFFDLLSGFGPFTLNGRSYIHRPLFLRQVLSASLVAQQEQPQGA
ncbi:hypothetical protein [Streptosporangium sp. NPDC004631]